MANNSLGNQVILPGQTIGIIGGGQLGRMMAIAARYKGYKIVVLDPTPNCPTAQVADEQIIAPYDDMDAIKRLTELSDVITYEFENVDLRAAAYIESKGKLPQGAYALEVTQNRAVEKRVISEAQLSVPPFAIVNNGEQCEQELQKILLPAVIKTCRGGYDGKGQLKIETEADFEEAIMFAEKSHPCIIEQWITFDKEISVVFTRSKAGEITFFPLAENEHRDHILYKTTVPAVISDAVKEKSLQAATVLGEKMQIVGTFTIEIFVKGDDIYLNEMAPRPHNSGHYTIEACNVSQFTQHIRAICGLPLMPVSLLQPAVMINILGENLDHAVKELHETGEGFLHLYGKEAPKEKRKMGHITFIGETVEQANEQAARFDKEV